MSEVNKMTKKERCWYIIDNVLIQSEADDISSYLDELEQQKAELMEFISSKLSEAWSKMGDTGSSDYMSKLNDENYWFGYFSALENAQDIIDKYKQQEERDEV